MKSRSLPRRDGAFFLLFLAVSACGGGGGGRPATVVSGNVRSAATGSVSLAPPSLFERVASFVLPEAVAQVLGVTVAIDNSSASTETDAQGFFRLEGNQFGPSVLRFTASGIDAALHLTLPSGGEFQLVNVDLEGGRVTVEERRLHMNGPITGIDCQGNLLQVLSGELIAFRVRLEAGTVLVDQDGQTLRCIDLVVGREADVQGTVDDNGNVHALRIQENPAPGEAARTVDFTADVQAVNCPAEITVERSGDDVRVQIAASTVVQDDNGDPLACEDLAQGDRVKVEGEEDSFGVRARTIERRPAPTPTPIP